MIKIGSSPYLECSSKGDRRFSAFYARIRSKNNSSIEELYQGFKIFDGENGFITGLSWREAKGRKANNQEEAAIYYSELWDLYFLENPQLLEVIKGYNGFSDIFGQTNHTCQAIEVYRIKNSFFSIF